MRYPLALLLLIIMACTATAQDVLTFDQPECAGISGFRGHWNSTIPVAADGERKQVDSQLKDRGQTAVWGGDGAGPLAFDAVHRNLLVRFPGAAQGIADALAQGKVVTKVELVLPYLDEEIWPQGQVDFPSATGYRYRMNWNCDKLYRSKRPNWHAIAFALRKPWVADPTVGPTYNAAVNGAVYWTRFGASDTTHDRYPTQLGPAEVSSYQPDGRMDVTAVLTDAVYGGTLAERLNRLQDCGFVVSKWETYDMRFFDGAYEFANGTGPRAILIQTPKLVVTFAAGEAAKVALPPAADVPALAAQHQAKPLGAPTAVVPSPEEVAALNEAFMAKPEWMPEWQYEHVLELMKLESGGTIEPFYYRVIPKYVQARAVQDASRAAKADKQEFTPADADYAVYLAWLDYINGERPRSWQGHLTAQRTVTWWYNYREAIPEAVQASILRSWEAWLMPDRPSAMTDAERKDYGDLSGQLIHPMADDPRVGMSEGKAAEWNQGDTYYNKTGDWRGNKSFFRSGFTRMMSTANFNSSASSGALLCGQIIGSEHAMADGRAGLMRFPFWMWTHSAGVGQEYIDHYYWAIASAGNKLFKDFAEQPEDQMAGWSIMSKTVNDLANGYHPNLKKLIGPASRTYYEHVLGEQDGLYHILHAISPQGALSDVDAGVLPALTVTKDAKGNAPRPISAWGHDYPPSEVAVQTMSGPWAEPWFGEIIDEKPLPWSSIVEKKVVADGDWVTTYFGVNYGLASIRHTPQRIHVLGHWRRAATRPDSMTEIGTLDMRMGYNETRIANDGAGVISEQGLYRTYQNGNKLIMLARPNAGHMAGKKAEIKSVQCTVALFNFEAPAPTWTIYVDSKAVESLPATASYGQVITIHDGVTYLAIRPLPTADLGRDTQIRLEAGVPQTPAHHGQTNIQPALLIHAYLYEKDAVIPEAALKALGETTTGFVVEMGDAAEYGSFAKFQAHIRGTTLAGDTSALTYTSGDATMAASWDSYTVDGQDPYAYAKAQKLWQDTPLTQMGQADLAKGGASVSRGTRHPELNMFLQTFPKQKIYVAMNLLPNYLDYSFQTPDGVRIIADGACSMGHWAVKDARAIDIKYHAFGSPYAPDEADVAATVLFVSGTPAKPTVTLNGADVSATLKAWKQGDVDGWLVSLTGTFPADDAIRARLDATLNK